jgi:multidrug efflux pump subunit AcrA (membrane-fusion protein)
MNRRIIHRVAREPAQEAPPSPERPAPDLPAERRRRKLAPFTSRGQLMAAMTGGALLLLIIWGVLQFRSSSAGDAAPADAALSATAIVERRDFVRTVRIHGVVEAVDSHTISVPRLSGPGLGQLTITRLAPNGTPVKRGDLLVEFDRQQQERNALDRRAEYLDLEEQIKKKRADQEAARARDDTELAQAENAVRAAELETRKNEVVSRIDAEKNQQNFEEARARLEQLRKTYQLKRAAAQAELRIQEIQRDRSRNALRFAEENARKLSIRAPLDGLAVLSTIWKSGQLGEVQEGDQVRAGVSIMQVVNPASMQVKARVNQADISSLRPGLAVKVRLDAYPDFELPGRLDRLAAIGVTSTMNAAVRTFTVTFAVQGSDSRLLPDLSASAEVEIERVAGAVVAPRDALLFENGSYFVRVRNGMGFDRVAVKPGAMSDTEAVIESGLGPGAVVARRL